MLSSNEDKNWESFYRSNEWNYFIVFGLILLAIILGWIIYLMVLLINLIF